MTKKKILLVLSFFVIMTGFLITPTKVNAYTYDGSNNYEITSVTMSNGNLIIKGWAINFPDGNRNKVDQLSNVYKLELVSATPGVSYSKTYDSVRNAGDQVDLTCLHLTKLITSESNSWLTGCENYTAQKDYASIESKYLRYNYDYWLKDENAAGGIWLRNVGFEFHIPIKDLEDEIKQQLGIKFFNCDLVATFKQSFKMNLHMYVNGGTEVVFNSISVYSDRVQGGSASYLGNLKDKMQIIVGNGLVRQWAQTKAPVLCIDKNGNPEWKGFNSSCTYRASYLDGDIHKIAGKIYGGKTIYGEYYWYRTNFNLYWNSGDGHYKVAPTTTECTGLYCSSWIPSSFVTIAEEGGGSTTIDLTFGCEPEEPPPDGCEEDSWEKDRPKEDTQELGCPVNGIDGTGNFNYDDGECLKMVEQDKYFKIQCNERSKLTTDNSPSVLAGEGFAYSFKLYGDRVCKGTFDFDQWLADFNDANNRMKAASDSWKEADAALNGDHTCDRDYHCEAPCPPEDDDDDDDSGGGGSIIKDAFDKIKDTIKDVIDKVTGGGKKGKTANPYDNITASSLIGKENSNNGVMFIGDGCGENCCDCACECTNHGGMDCGTFDSWMDQIEQAESDFAAAEADRDYLEERFNYFKDWAGDYQYNPTGDLEIEEPGFGATYRLSDLDASIDRSKQNNSATTNAYSFAPTAPRSEDADYFQGSISSGDLTTKTYNGYDTWGKKSEVTGVYNLPLACIYKDLMATVFYYPGTGRTCPSGSIDGGNMYFTDFNTRTGTYDINFNIENMGHVKQWSYDITCNYNVTNKLKPDKGGPDGGGGDPDPQYPGGYFYRTISLYDPFPNGRDRITGSNWVGNEDLISPDVYSYTDRQSEYIVNLTYADISSIKSDNKRNQVGSYNDIYLGRDNMNSANPYKDYRSRFIHDSTYGFSNLFEKAGER